MTDYTITKTENSTTINVPIGRKYKNKLNGTTYKNSSEGVKMLVDGQNWRRVGSAYLESILLGGDITETDQFTLNFKTQTGTLVSVEASTKPSELLSNLDEQVSLNDFYIDYLSTVGARVHLADYINTVLVDIYESQEVLSELIEETPETPEPSTPDTPDTPTPSEPAIKTSTTISTSKGDLTISLQGYNTQQSVISFDFKDQNQQTIGKSTYTQTGSNTLTLDEETGETITIQAITNSNIPAQQNFYWIQEQWAIRGNFGTVISNYGLRVTYHPATGEDTVEDLMVGIPPLEVTTGGGELTNLIHLPSGNIYLQINKLDSVNGWIGYTIHYDNGTSYELIDGMIQKRGSPYKFYWVEDTTTPSAATYETPYVSFDEIIINETTIPVDSYTNYDKSSQQFMVYVDFKSYVELYNDVRLKVSVKYPDSEETEILYF